MQQYLNLIKYVMHEGVDKKDRTGVGTRSAFGTQLKFDLTKGFPAVTTKKLAWRAVVSELLWFIEGSTNERRLCKILHGTDKEAYRTIWTDNFENQGKALGYTDGELGRIYGYQWRYWNGITDQIQNAIDLIKNDPFSRRIIVNAWNASDLDKMALPPCHVLYQFNVEPDEQGKPAYLSLLWYQRSVDLGLGLPFNIASYALLTHIIARITGLSPKKLVFSGGDTHIYLNHMDALKKQIARKPYALPTLRMPDIKSLKDLEACKVSDFVLEGYTCHKPLYMQMAV